MQITALKDSNRSNMAYQGKLYICFDTCALTPYVLTSLDTLLRRFKVVPIPMTSTVDKWLALGSDFVVGVARERGKAWSWVL